MHTDVAGPRRALELILGRGGKLTSLTSAN